MRTNQANTLKEIIKKRNQGLTSLNDVISNSSNITKMDEEKQKQLDIVNRIDLDNETSIVKKKPSKRRIFFTSGSSTQGVTTTILNLSTMLADNYNKKVLCTTFNEINNVKKMQDFFFYNKVFENRPNKFSKIIKEKRKVEEAVYEFPYTHNLSFLNNDFFSNVTQLSSIANEAFNKATYYFYKEKYDLMLVDISLDKLLEVDISENEEIVIVTTLENEDLTINYTLAKKLLSITPHVKLFFNKTNSINDIEQVSNKIMSLSDNKLEVIGSIMKSDIVNFNSIRNNPLFIKKNIDLPFSNFYQQSAKKIMN